MFTLGQQYQSVEDEKAQRSSSEDDFGSEDALIEGTPIRKPKSFFRRRWPLILHLSTSLVNLALFSFLLLRTLFSVVPTQLQCGNVLERWIPGYENGVEYERQRFIGTFGAKSEFTGYGPEVDDAWANITNGGAVGISKEEWEEINEYHDYPVIMEETPAGGTGPYLASIDVYHQLHCLDMLRKNIHRDYYNDKAFSFQGQPDEVIENHMEHCVEALRQTLMCNGDLSLLTYNWVKTRNTPYPNFNSLHTCKKWDKLHSWSMARDVTRMSTTPPLKPEGVVGMWPPP